MPDRMSVGGDHSKKVIAFPIENVPIGSNWGIPFFLTDTHGAMSKICFSWRPSSYRSSLWQLHKVLWVNDDLGNDVSTVDYSSLSCEHGARESECSGLGYAERYQRERKSVVLVQTRRYLHPPVAG
jgi:hypothetical protein